NLQRKDEPRKLAARGDLHQRPRLGDRIRPDEEGHPRDAARAALGEGNSLYIGNEARLVELEGAELDHDLFVEGLRRLGTRLAQIERQSLVALACGYCGAGELSAPRLALIDR